MTAFCTTNMHAHICIHTHNYKSMPNSVEHKIEGRHLASLDREDLVNMEIMQVTVGHFSN